MGPDEPVIDELARGLYYQVGRKPFWSGTERLNSSQRLVRCLRYYMSDNVKCRENLSVAKRHLSMG